jgi:hypothetical protein
MNEQPDNLMTKGEPLELNSGALRELAGEYFAEDFPNPDRRDCPAPARLQALAQTDRLPDDELRAHLFGCSACFTAYREARAMQPVATPELSWRDKLATTFTWRPGLAWAGAAVLLLGLSWLMRAPRHNEPSPAPSLLAQQSPTPTVTPAPTLVLETPPSAPDAITKAVDLNNYLALRDAAATNGDRTIQLAPVLTRLQLRLPEGSLSGVYSVSLWGESNQTVLPAQTVRRRGNTLTATMDLRRFGAKNLRLRIQGPGEAPDFYPVQIGTAPRQP